MSSRKQLAPVHHVAPVPQRGSAGPASPVSSLMQRASSEPGRSLDGSVRSPLEQRLGHDFSKVRIHSGPASASVVEGYGARAFALGNDIYLGADARRMAVPQRRQLLAHEAVHTAQQGHLPARLSESLPVSNPTDRAEVEAKDVAESAFSDTAGRAGSPSLALRDRLRSQSGEGPAISRVPAPLIQRDLKGKHATIDGTFDLNLITKSNPGGKNGMAGTIKFKASETSPDSTNIRLLQIVRDENLSTGKEYVWTGAEADRNKMMTKSGTAGVTPGFFVDHSAAAASPRTKKSDPTVQPYYREYWPNASSSQDGSKKGKTIKEASLWDFPGSGGKRRFTFETAAKATDTGYIYASLHWGFTISDPAKGTITNEHAKAELFTSATFGAAVTAFNEFYKNPGASTAPTK